MIEEFDILDQDFITKAQKLVGDDFFQHYYLINIINAVMNGNLNLYDAYIITDDNSWVIGLRADGNYLLYSKEVTSKQLQVIMHRTDFSIFQNGYHFMGTRELIEKIQSAASINFKVFKNRRYYICDKVNHYLKNPLLTVSLADISDLNELAQMSCEYFEDEYHGENNKDLETMKEDVSRLIQQGDGLWTLKTEKLLKSMCSVIPTAVNVPLIGSFFTKRESRNLGFGKNLLFEVTEKLLKEYNECWLIADETNLESLAVFEKVGYKPVYRTLDLIVNNA
jgi:predicted GNAT family acetyltransferase